MLEKIREGSQGTWAVVILGIVILSFVFAGVGGYVSSSSSAAASVNGDDISQTTFQRAYDSERARMQSQYGETFTALSSDPSYLNQFRQSVLDRLIADKLIEQVAAELGLRVSNAQIREQILTMPEFQIGGQFNNDRFQAALRSVGFQANTFRDYMRNEMTRQQVAQALLGSEFALSNEASRVLAMQQQTRDLQYITVPTSLFSEQVEVSEEDIDIYYQQNLDQFDTEEKVSLEYISLSSEDLMADMDVTEEELKDLYDKSSNEFQSEETRRVSHILVELGEDQQAARDKAQQAVDRLAAGEDFAAVAADLSDDTFSAENGGDLDFFSKGDMDPAFEKAAYELAQVGDVSDIVESEYGLHIIKLTDINAAKVTPFEEVEAVLAERIKREKATEKLYLIQTEVETLAFEMPDSLNDVAAATDLTVKSTDLFTRNAPPEALSSPVVVAKAFSDELVQDRVNSEVIATGDNQFMVIRVKQHEPERTKGLEEVKEQIVTQLTAQKAQDAAREWAQGLLTDMQAEVNIAEKLAQMDLGWELQANIGRFGSSVPRAIVDKAFQLSTAKDQNQAVVELASGDVGIVQVNNIHQNQELPEEQLRAMQQRLAQMQSQGVYASLIEALRVKADITVYNLAVN
ncbi:SurA N-terminal domain-containing protein [Aliiglaciecola litoralis]|uniref:Periplasmic chaperone PpiD n=1 Tax=Aliiglaciecola litoralis TaxID=582857 RepID=A0ABP3X267_9ALTE